MLSRRTFVAAIVVCLVLAGGSRSFHAAERVDVQKLQEDWRGAMVDGNLSALEAVYSDDLIYVHSNARIQNKQEFLSQLRTEPTRYRSITPCDMPQIRAYDHTAIVSACNKLDVVSGRTGKPVRTFRKHQFLTVYMNEGGKWRIVAMQTTLLPPEKQD